MLYELEECEKNHPLIILAEEKDLINILRNNHHCSIRYDSPDYYIEDFWQQCMTIDLKLKLITYEKINDV